MDARARIDTISELAASQAGLFTAAQAKRFGVSGDAIAYMAKTGRIERLEHGVYRISGIPSTEQQDIYAVWLGTDPERMAFERNKSFDGIVVGGRSAAALHDIGDFFLSPFVFLTRDRINSKRQNVVFRKRGIEADDVVYLDGGLPVTSIARTLYDLKVDHEDPSLLHDAARDALRQGASFDHERLLELARNSPTRKRTRYLKDFTLMLEGGDT